MAKQIFTIHRTYFAATDVQVVAENEEEALRLAESRFELIPASHLCLQEDATDVVKTEPMTEDIDQLTAMAIARIREEAEEVGDAICFKEVDVTICGREYDAVFNVSEDVERDVQVDSAYIVQDDAEPEDAFIVVQFEEDYIRTFDLEDMRLDEFSEIDQIAILKAILS